MMDPKFQTAVLRVYQVMGMMILLMAGGALYLTASAPTPEGTIPTGEGSAFFLLLAALREVIGFIARLADGQREHVRDVQLFNSTNARLPLRAHIENDKDDPVPVEPTDSKLD